MNENNNINKDNYLNFEHYCINKHIVDFKHKTYHWSVIPDTVLIDSGYFESEDELRNRRKNNKNLLREYGLDGISLEINNNNNNIIYHGIQVKLWNNTICANDLGTFTSVLFHRFSDESKGYLYHTSNLEKTFEKDIKKKNKIISIKIDNPYLEEKNNKNNDKNIFLRPYQIEAINCLKKDWKGIKSLILPCGTGKTIIFSEYLKFKKFKNVFIFSPLTILTEQNLDVTKKYLPEYNSVLVDVNGTLDFNDILINLNKNTIFSSTFRSAENLISKIFTINNNYNLSNNTMALFRNLFTIILSIIILNIF